MDLKTRLEVLPCGKCEEMMDCDLCIFQKEAKELYQQIRADAIEELTKGVLEELKECAEAWEYYFDKDNYSLVSTVLLTKAEQLKENNNE